MAPRAATGRRWSCSRWGSRGSFPMPARGWSCALGYLLTHTGPGSGQAGDGADALLSFGSSLPMGGAFHPDGTPVLYARVADPALSPYWRAAVYDRYAQGVWRALPAHLVKE